MLEPRKTNKVRVSDYPHKNVSLSVPGDSHQRGYMLSVNENNSLKATGNRKKAEAVLHQSEDWVCFFLSNRVLLFSLGG